MILILVLIGLVLRQERPEALADEAATTADGFPAELAVGAERCISGACAHSDAQRPAKNFSAQCAAFVDRPRQRRSLGPTREYRPRSARVRCPPRKPARAQLGRPRQQGAPDT